MRSTFSLRRHAKWPLLIAVAGALLAVPTRIAWRRLAAAQRAERLEARSRNRAWLQARLEAGLDDDELGDDLELGVEIVFSNPDEARDAFLAKLAAMQDAGVVEFRGPELRDVQVATGRSAAWIYNKLKAAVKLGQLEWTENGFRFVERQALAPQVAPVPGAAGQEAAS